MSVRRHRLRTLVRRALLSLAATAFAAATPAASSTGLNALYISTDSTLNLNGLVVQPRDAVRTFPLALANLGALPNEANLIGYHRSADGRQLFTLDVTATLAGGITATSADVIAYDGVSYSIEFNGLTRGIPRGVQIDAIAAIDGDLLLSFDTAVSFAGFTADDEDLVRVSAGSISLFFDGSAAGVAPGLDLDAAERLSNGHLLLSFDGSGSLGGVAFDDDDVLEHDPQAGTWELIFDGGLVGPSFAGADVDAVAAEEVFTATPTSEPTDTTPPTETPNPTATGTPLPPTQTATVVPTETQGSGATDTPTEAPTRTLVPTQTETATSVPSTATPQVSATATETPIVSATPTATGEVPTPSPTSEAATPTPTATSSPEASATPTELVGFLAGDANCDGRVNVADVTEVVDLVANNQSQCGSDANCDGVTDSADIQATVSLVFVAPAACP